MDPSALCVPTGLCAAQCGDPARSAHHQRGRRGRQLPLHRLHRRRLRAVLRRRHGCGGRRIRAVPVRRLARRCRLRGHGRLRLRCPAAPGGRRPGLRRSCGRRLRPVPTPAAAGGSHAIVSARATVRERGEWEKHP